MAGRKSTKSENPEVVPALDENTAAATVTDPPEQELSAEVTEDPAAEAVSEEQDILSDDILTEPEEKPETPVEDAKAEQKEPQNAEQEEKVFKITCRNNVSGLIGGVVFLGGVGYTRDSYSASWFANKDGYSVDLKE